MYKGEPHKMETTIIARQDRTTGRRLKRCTKNRHFGRQQSFFTGEIFFDPIFLEMSQNFRAKNVLSNLKNFPVFDDLTKHRQIDFVLRKSPRSTTDDVSRLVLNSKF
jgi:hypothetical protein